MAVLDILLYPDDRLRQECDPVQDLGAVQGLVDDMVATMAGAPGCVGIAAPQVGALVQVVVVDCGQARKPPPGHHGRLIMINPVILSWSGMAVAREGCLSLPDYTGNVMRAEGVSVQFQDRQGHEHVISVEGFEARVVQHELDHLEGRLFIDRLVSRKADLFTRKNRL